MGETKKIRIGNDIRLAVDLRQYVDHNHYLEERNVYNPGDRDYEDLDKNIWVNKKSEVYYPNQYSESEVSSTQDFDFKPGFGSPVSIRSIKAIFVNISR